MKTLNTLTGILVIAGLALSGPALAGKKRSKTAATAATTITTWTSGAATLEHPGRLLASNCFQCHGTNGHGMESLAGKAAGEITEELYEMKQKPIGADIMHVYAQGFTTDQANLIADYFSKQQP